MKKLAIFLILVVGMALFAGCNASKTNGKDTANFADYQGDWTIQVIEDEELYRMAALDVYYGSTGITINEITNGEVQGAIYSVQGAPSYRQSEVAFSGKIAGEKLQTTYKDEGWMYSGNIELTFHDGLITANITRDKADDMPMWGIPEGSFTFVRPIETEIVTMSDQEKNDLELLLNPATRDAIVPFAEGTLTDETMIHFVSYNLALGLIDPSEFGDKVISKADVVFDESVMNELTKKYFGVEVKKHQTDDIATYQNGKYTVPALGGVTDYPVVQLVIKDTAKPNYVYAVVDYMLDTPEEGTTFQYERLFTLQKNNGYRIKAIKEVVSPIDFELLTQVMEEKA